jgi:DNA-binding CsgD family transcriptional regulator
MSTCALFPDPESDLVSVDPSPGDDGTDPASACDAEEARPIELDAGHVDQLLLEAFTRARRRLRGAVVAISDRTMIANPGASEILQPEDRRVLWPPAQSGRRHATERDVPLVLANGMIVYRTCYPVESDGRLVGVVLHLQAAPPARANLIASPGAGSPERGAALRSILPTVGAALLADWLDLTDSERTVAELVGQGLSNKQTGRRLFMSPYTVDYHLRRIYRKLGITSRVELARLLGEHYESLADAALPEDRIA